MSRVWVHRSLDFGVYRYISLMSTIQKLRLGTLQYSVNFYGSWVSACYFASFSIISSFKQINSRFYTSFRSYFFVRNDISQSDLVCSCLSCDNTTEEWWTVFLFHFFSPHGIQPRLRLHDIDTFDGFEISLVFENINDFLILLNRSWILNAIQTNFIWKLYSNLFTYRYFILHCIIVIGSEEKKKNESMSRKFFMVCLHRNSIFLIRCAYIRV